MLNYPKIDPIALKIGFLEIHWYGVMYLVGFVLAWWLGSYRAKRSHGEWTVHQVGDFIFYGALGVVFGGRIGYVFFYNWKNFVSDPVMLFKIWQGGMSFHGGLVGVVIASYFFARCYKKTLFQVTDFAAPLAPLGLAAGRLGNFINGELWGRVTGMPWGMIYPQAGFLPRHPSELYEFFCEGILLFIIVWFYSSKPKPRMAISALFLVGYSVIRFMLEFFRQPDVQLGFVAFNWITLGQLLCIPMFILGGVLLIFAYKINKIGE